MRIGRSDTDVRVLVIAEIGNNHEGDIGLARELVERAAEAGADAVKFQTIRAERLVRRSEVARFQRLKRFELSMSAFAELGELAHMRGLLFLSTPFDFESARELVPLVDALKIASGDNTFESLVRTAVGSGKPIIVSTGLLDLMSVERLVGSIREHSTEGGGRTELGVLHCVSAYPVPPEQANVRAVATLRTALDCTVGYSDHTIGIEAALAAVALGARIIEKHFTIDKQFSDFRDHHLSADLPEMRELVERIRRMEPVLGSGEKVPQPCELEGSIAFRRSLVAAGDLASGTALRLEDLSWLRPADGIPPGSEGLVLGRRLKRPLAAGERIDLADLE